MGFDFGRTSIIKGDRIMENTEILDKYIGEVYEEDVFAYTNMNMQKWDEKRIVKKLRAYKKGDLQFCWPAAFTEGLWHVYYGMIKPAVTYDLITMVIGGLLIRFSFGAFVCLWMILAFIKGFRAYPLYYIYMKKAVEQRGLLMRSPIKSKSAAESLRKAAKPSLSLLRVAVYLFFKCFAAVCLDSIFFSMFCMME